MAKKKVVEKPIEEILEETPVVEEVVEEAPVVEEVKEEKKPTKKNSKSLLNEGEFKVTVIPERLNIRIQPNGDIIEVVNVGTVMVAKKCEDEKWLQVITPNNKEGYAMTEFLHK